VIEKKIKNKKEVKKVKQNKTKQNKTKQNKTKQNKTKQNKMENGQTDDNFKKFVDQMIEMNEQYSIIFKFIKENNYDCPLISLKEHQPVLSLDMDIDSVNKEEKISLPLSPKKQNKTKQQKKKK
jgi:hypothetical protein